jgi:hypothetical protein
MVSEETKNKIATAFIDRGLHKLISRKLLVWSFGTAGVPFGFITGEQWVQLSMVYIGTQAAMDFFLNYIKAKNGTQQ